MTSFVYKPQKQKICVEMVNSSSEAQWLLKMSSGLFLAAAGDLMARWRHRCTPRLKMRMQEGSIMRLLVMKKTEKTMEPYLLLTQARVSGNWTGSDERLWWRGESLCEAVGIWEQKAFLKPTWGCLSGLWQRSDQTLCEIKCWWWNNSKIVQRFLIAIVLRYVIKYYTSSKKNRNKTTMRVNSFGLKWHKNLIVLHFFYI